MDELRAYYESWDEDTRLASRHGQVEFLTTMHYIERYLRPGMRVLEIGTGTGRYSHALAQRGYEVDAVELVERNIDVFRQNTLPGERVTVRQGNALDLAGFETGGYDVTLLLGPMYHLHTEGEQRRALQEALRVTRRGGVLFAAYCCNDATMFQCGFGQGDIQREPYRSLIDPVTFKAAS
ncbi:MAG: class I SAM-dependent methyltransferase, partial [Candidatus Spyradocola sp.]